MEVLNNSRVLSLHEIVNKLFNNSFLSDITFTIDQKQIRAHSFILMSRSVVYQEQFQHNQGDQKLIPIQQYDFDAFYEFMHFIYNDECKITKENVVSLFELSIAFKIGKLTDFIIDRIKADNLIYEMYCLYEYCIINDLQEVNDEIELFIGRHLLDILQSDYFLHTQQEVMENLLKMDFVGSEVKPIQEINILNGLVRWINFYCIGNKLKWRERRTKFDHLIRLIRVPVIKPNELRRCIEQCDNLFTDDDIVSFSNQSPNSKWTRVERYHVDSKLWYDLNIFD